MNQVSVQADSTSEHPVPTITEQTVPVQPDTVPPVHIHEATQKLTETMHGIRRLMNQVKEQEKMNGINCEGCEKSTAEYAVDYGSLPPNYSNLDLRERLKYWKDRYQFLICLRSKVAGDKLVKNNAGIADMSDAYRPSHICDIASSLFNNEWGDACNELESEVDTFKVGKINNMAEKLLYETLMKAYELYVINKDRTTDEKERMLIEWASNNKKIKLDYFSKYCKQATVLCHHMLKCSPAMFFGDVKYGEKIDRDVYKLYMKKGDVVDCIIFPFFHFSIFPFFHFSIFPFFHFSIFPFFHFSIFPFFHFSIFPFFHFSIFASG